ncbi:MAG TPA: ribosome silencing factor [Bacillota bacterium]|nr:ribosome silencing factor [Bacillota bacterium]HQC35834.1 ribosome silencing factor [Bacillota bacterium]
MNNKELALFSARFLDGKKALDVLILDISAHSGFADYFVIASASSMRQLAALSEELSDKLAEQGMEARQIEGRGESGWILMDYGDVIVNIFTKEQREHYQLEKVWGDCSSVEFEERQ